MAVTNDGRMNLNVIIMKKLLFSAIFLFAALTPVFSQVVQDLKSAGKDVKDATVTGADKTGTATKKVYKKTKNGVKKGVNKSATATKKGADKLANKTAPSSTASPK